MFTLSVFYDIICPFRGDIMAVDYLLSRGFKESEAYELLQSLLEKREYYALKRLYCGKDDYKKFIQGEVIEYSTEYPEGHETYASISTYNNQVIECRVYNHHNNIKIRKRDYNSNPVSEVEHIFTYDYKTGDSSASLIHKNIYGSNDKEYSKVTKYSKAIFDYKHDLVDYQDEVIEFENKKRKYI